MFFLERASRSLGFGMSSGLRGIEKRYLWCYHVALRSSCGFNASRWGSRMSMSFCLQFLWLHLLIACGDGAPFGSSAGCDPVVGCSASWFLQAIVSILLFRLERRVLCILTAAITDLKGQIASISSGLPKFICRINSSVFVLLYLHSAIPSWLGALHRCCHVAALLTAGTLMMATSLHLDFPTILIFHPLLCLRFLAP